MQRLSKNIHGVKNQDVTITGLLIKVPGINKARKEYDITITLIEESDGGYTSSISEHSFVEDSHIAGLRFFKTAGQFDNAQSSTTYDSTKQNKPIKSLDENCSFIASTVRYYFSMVTDESIKSFDTHVTLRYVDKAMNASEQKLAVSNIHEIKQATALFLNNKLSEAVNTPFLVHHVSRQS